MGLIATLNHLLNFAAPAIGLASLVTLGRHFLMKKRAPALSLPAQFAINLVANCAVLAVCLVLLGRDGKMATYAAMALACASSQWLMARGWQT